MKKILIGLVAVLVLGFALRAGATAVANSWSAGDAREVDYLTPGTVKTQLGTRLRGLMQEDGVNVSASSSLGPESLTATYESFSYTSSAAIGNSYTLADGLPNQTVTFILATDGGKNVRITPSTKTGFTNIELDDAKDSATLRWTGATHGWVLSGNAGATIN